MKIEERITLIIVFVALIFTLIFAVEAKSQNQKNEKDYISGKVYGTVKSIDGEELIGVFVSIKGTDTGVMTDEKGHYEIVLPGNKTSYKLSFSYIGMTTAVKDVFSSGELNILMENDNTLSEAVVIGAYGLRQRREDMIGSAFQVNSEMLKDKPKTRIDGILNGLVPGLLVENKADYAGSTRPRFNVRVRGEASLAASNEPLWIIDGVPTYTGDKNNAMPGMSVSISPLSLIDPNDIESITVLKDADQTTIYGANGANGVILITTKRGNSDNQPLKINATLNFGVSAPDKSTMFKMMNAAQYLEVAKEAWVNAGNKLSDFPYQDNDYNNYSQTSTNWMDKYIGVGSTTYASLSANSASKKTKNYISCSYYRNSNIVRGDYSGRFYLRMNQNYNFTKNLKAGISLAASYNENNIFPLGKSYISTLPIFSPYLEDGKTFRLYNKVWNDTKKRNVMRRFYDNKLPDRELSDNKQSILKTIGNFNIEWQIVKGLKASSVFGAEYQHSLGDNYRSRHTLEGMDDKGNGIGYAKRENAAYITWTNTNRLDYAGTFDKHSVGCMLGIEFHSAAYKSSAASGSGFINDKIKEISYSGRNGRNAEGFSSISRTMSYFLRGTYSYNSKYYISFNYRRDGNSAFGKYSKWGSFWSIGSSWNIHKENFFHSDFINRLKLKATYGTSGNSRIDTSVAAGSYSMSDSYSYMGNIGARLASLPNPGLSWETTQTINTGLDIGLGRFIDIGIEYYNNITRNLLSRIYVSKTISDDRIYANVGSIKNEGIEISLKSYNIKTSDFEWTTVLNFSHNKNRILNLYEGIPTSFGSSIWMEGHDSNTYYLVRWAGVDPADGMPMWYDKVGNVTKTYSLNDRVPDRCSTPFGYGGLINDFRWKNFSLSFQINYVLGGYALASYASNYMKDGYDITSGNQAVEIYYGRWKKPGDLARYPKVSQKSTNSGRLSTRYLYNKTNFNLTNLTLSYNLPESITSRIHMKSGSISLICDNLYLFTPDEKFGMNSYKTVMNGYPVTRTFTFSLNLAF